MPEVFAVIRAWLADHAMGILLWAVSAGWFTAGIIAARLWDRQLVGF